MSLKLLKNRQGQGLVEYLIVVSIMAIGTMAIMEVLSQTTSAKFAKITQTLQGKTGQGGGREIRVDPISEVHFKKIDMSNFFDGAVIGGKK